MDEVYQYAMRAEVKLNHGKNKLVSKKGEKQSLKASQNEELGESLVVKPYFGGKVAFSGKGRGNHMVAKDH